ncbi:MAG: hypothetical protein J6O09_00640 [Lachnospiraceae bacterium]|nr:hypothetical protein [Lachnospiraceae bacterium]
MQRKIFKKLLLAILSFTLFFILFSCAPKEGDKKTIKFGKQDGVSLEWEILREDYMERVLLCKNVVDAIPYNTGEAGLEWQDTTLYDYLNSDFVNEHFDEKEREVLLPINDNDDGVVTMLSTDNLIDMYETICIGDYEYYNADTFNANVDIVAKPLDRALQNEVEIYDNEVFAEIMHQDKIDERYEFANGCVSYWLLDRDEESQLIYYVMPTGYVSTIEENREYIGVRPVIRIKR